LLEGGGTPGDCGEQRVPPPRPAGTDDGAESGPYIWALKDVTLNQDGERWRDIGFDIDGRCSQPPDPDVECRPPVETAQPEVDGNGGIDNALGHQLLPAVAITIPELETESRDSQDLGLGVVVLDIRGWNGEPDDPRVDVHMSITVGGTPVESGATEPPADVEFTDTAVLDSTGAALPNPDWSGVDNWFWSREDMFLMGDPERPFIRDDNAYIAGDVLVFTLPERSEIFFRGVTQSLTVRITGGIASGVISGDRRTIENVMFGGRWSVNDILDTAEIVGICRGTPQYDIMQNLLARVADVRSDARSGGTGLPCDAVSVGIQFTGYPGRFAGIGPVLPIGNACADMMMAGP
jgi:hypothetical protein